MKRFLTRLVLFLTVFPALLGIAFWSVGHYLPAVSLVVLATLAAANEMAFLLEVRGFPVNRFLIPVVGALFPVLGYLELVGWISTTEALAVIVVVLLVAFGRHVFVSRHQSIRHILLKVSGHLTVLVYPSSLSYFLVRLFGFEPAGPIVMVLLMATFGNDAMAYAAGNLLGQKGVLRVSPNKSLVGFFAGWLVSVGVLVVSSRLRPDLFGPPPLAAIAGVAVGAATIVGDLFESALKRSAGVKDSGRIIPGRGGMLDSIDSLLFSAPVYYLYLQALGRLS